MKLKITQYEFMPILLNSKINFINLKGNSLKGSSICLETPNNTDGVCVDISINHQLYKISPGMKTNTKFTIQVK